MRALGLMSGTSMDGIDLAMIETDGERIAAFGETSYRPYSDAERLVLRQALSAARGVTDRTERPDALRAAERVVNDAHAALVLSFLSEHGMSAGDVDVIGFHGQTVFHAPERGMTVQLGDGDRLARETGIRVVYDLRANDVAAGGEGAPLAPVFHKALAAGLPGPLGILNLGGVANITWIGEGDEDLIAFDTGPANALIDDFVHTRTGAAMDVGGALARSGAVNDALLARWLQHPYFDRLAPKSLDRDDFTAPGVDALSTEEGAATLTAFTAATVAAGFKHLPRPPVRLIAVGGGAHNPVLLEMIAARTGVSVTPAADIGWSGDFIEAQAFAYMAVRALDGRPITFPGTTGAPWPMSGGLIALP
ncbi:anhydro-N-acetylmuramic acid kinase [Breoghania sp. L-A4]|nr:anhydro-N-acetylmuramic acid kinase [Breoghania sp. L-A4]AXS42602.1 anhydro-N-acetylmuramic acid kinase [Breoghania sp. L-A4]